MDRALTLLVCGGRDYRNAAKVEHVLHAVHARRGIALLVEGGARGADAHARRWAQANGIAHARVDAEWHKYGNAAGSIRNARMLRDYPVDGVIAFPGGTGTADMVAKATAAGIKVMRIKD